MTTSTDIVNRALQVIGTRTTIASLAENSNEAIQASLVYTPLVNWCLVQANWNFARRSAVLTNRVSFSGAPWTTAQPTPQWTQQYDMPGDYLKAIYIFDLSALNSDSTAFTGDPVRFVVADVGATKTVILTNLNGAGLVYTCAAGENLWSPGFERFAVHALAYTLCQTLGDKELVASLYERMVHMFVSAEQTNREEGLMFGDTSPEWIQALGIPYPERRFDRRRQQAPSRRGQASDDGN